VAGTLVALLRHICVDDLMCGFIQCGPDNQDVVVVKTYLVILARQLSGCGVALAPGGGKIGDAIH
jgi:hypothetical protein